MEFGHRNDGRSVSAKPRQRNRNRQDRWGAQRNRTSDATRKSKDQPPMSSNNPLFVWTEDEKERNKMIIIFQEESGRNEEWNTKYIHSNMFLLGYGAYGSVFQVTTRLYPQSKHMIAKERYVYHPEFLARYASQRKLKTEQQNNLKDRHRHDRLFDTVAIKYEILEQSQLEDGNTRFYLFLRREFLVLDTVWRKFPKLLVGFPVVFDFGYIGDKLLYGVNPKYKNIFTYLNIQGEEVKFFADTNNRNLTGVTKVSYMSMELLGPSVEDYRSYFEPWYADSDIKPYFQVRTTFRIMDQLLCRLYMLHKAGFVHHDLKPDNLAVGHGRAMNTIYLIDFGFAKQVADIPVAEWMGSRKFISVDTYNGEKPNYSQDIESWFYLMTALLFDSLPWADEVILPMLDKNAEESTKWALVSAIKKTWWGEWNSALTLHSLLDGITSLHKREVPDIRQIMELVHRKVRDLRSHMRQINDSNTINAELANNQSSVSRGYMSLRKVLLQIFHLPNIGSNPMLGDTEFRSYQEARKSNGLSPFGWDSSDFAWEWDRNHGRMINNKHMVGAEDGLNAMSDNIAEFQMPTPLGAHNTAARVRRQLRRLAFELRDEIGPGVGGGGGGVRRMRAPVATPASAGAAGRRSRPDEVSYVYDPASNTLIPKYRNGYRPGPRAEVSTGQLGAGVRFNDTNVKLCQLANPSFLL